MPSQNKTILIVGSLQHTQTHHIFKALKAKHEKVVVLEPILVDGNEQSLSWQDDRITWLDQDMSISTIESIFLANRASPVPLPYVFNQYPNQRINYPEWFQEYGLQRDRSDMALSLLLAYEQAGISMINAPSSSNKSRRKPYQISMMKAVGCPMPETLVTNSASQAKAFIQRHKNVIVKPAAGGSLTLNAHELSEEHLQELRHAPAIFQRRIDGPDLRVMLLDGKIMSSVVINVPKGTLDFRGDPGYEQGTTTYTPITLPEAIQAHCINAAQALGLRYTGIDIKVETDSEGHEHYFFLECNSGPMYLDIEYKTGQPITQHICQALLPSP